jgi:hypothetical protein
VAFVGGLTAPAHRLQPTERAAAKTRLDARRQLTSLIGDFCNKIGTSRTSGDVRLESAKWAKADMIRSLLPIAIL